MQYMHVLAFLRFSVGKHTLQDSLQQKLIHLQDDILLCVCGWIRAQKSNFRGSFTSKLNTEEILQKSTSKEEIKYVHIIRDTVLLTFY